MRQYFKFTFLILIGLAIYCLVKNSPIFNTQKQNSHKKLEFSICDSIYYFEQPRWWDSINVLVDDSLMTISKSADEYLNLCRKYRFKKLYSDSLYKNSYNQDIKYAVKAKYLYAKLKNSFNSEFLHSLSENVSHELSIDINKVLFNCDVKYHSSLTAYEIGNDYFSICEYKKAKSYYKLALQLNEEEKEKEKEKENDNRSKLSSYKNKKEWILKKLSEISQKTKDTRNKDFCLFRNKVNNLLLNLEKYSTPKRKKEIEAFIENRNFKEIMDEAVYEATDYFFMSKTDYELALCNLLYEDSKTEMPLIMNLKTNTIVKENFRDFNMLDHMNFKIGINDILTVNEDRNEWLISFWSDIENSHGTTSVYLKGYEITGVYSVD